MKVIDTHCHYNLEPLYSGKKSHFSIKDDNHLLTMNWKDHWKNAVDKGVVGGVVVGSNIQTSLSGLKVAEEESKIIAAIGVHPHHAEDLSLEKYKEFFEKHLPHEKIKAIGETGLDYFRLERNTEKFAKTKKTQHDLFKLQIEIANKYGLPLIIHVRDNEEGAYWETLEILRKNLDSKTKFVLHCVSGPTKYVQDAISMGAYIGFDGNITYKNAENIRNLFRLVPEEKLLIETDAPYLPPLGYRGQVCEPWMVTEVAKYVEEEFSINLDTVFENSKKFFSYQF